MSRRKMPVTGATPIGLGLNELVVHVKGGEDLRPGDTLRVEEDEEGNTVVVLIKRQPN